MQDLGSGVLDHRRRDFHGLARGDQRSESLDSVINCFWEGATPEEICQDFPSLSLTQVYGAIAYYLRQRDKIDAYLQAGRDSAEKLHQELNSRHREFLSKLRQQLLSSRQSPTPA